MKKLPSLLLIFVMAFAVCALVSLEDVRESGDLYSRSEMLKQSPLELSGHHKICEIGTQSLVPHVRSAVFAEGEIPSAILLSLTTCILRC